MAPNTNLAELASKDEFDQAVRDLTAAADAYYNSDAELMTDGTYDALTDAVAAALQAHPDWRTDDAAALIERVAGGTSPAGGVAHGTRMLSLAKVQLPSAADTEGRAGIYADIASFMAKAPDAVWVVEPKLDGLALRAVYREGKLVEAALRGDGTGGDSVLENVTRGEGVAGLPVVLPAPVDLEIRGEVYMTSTQFSQAQELRVARGGDEFVNARAATAGAIRKSGADNWMPLSFAAYDLTDQDGSIVTDPNLHSRRMAHATDMGFTTAANVGGARLGYTHKAIDTIQAAVEALEAARHDLGFDIDGAVIKANDDATRKSLGERSSTPAWAVAVKYPPEVAESTLRDITVGVGRTGRITLRARIDPTFVGGSTVEFATLHDTDFIKREGLGIGAKVLVERRGDVIPRVQAPLNRLANANVEAWVPPASCPQCGGEWDKTSVHWRCHNAECSVAGRLMYWGQRDCLYVQGLGAAVVEALVEATLDGDRSISSVADLYDMTLDEWAGLQIGVTSAGKPKLLGVVTARKLIDQLEQSKSQPLNRVITGLGIRMTGRTVGGWLADHFGSMDALRAASVGEVAAVKGLGDIKAKHIVDGLAAMGPVIDRLAAHGLAMVGEVSDDTELTLVDDSGNARAVVISGKVPAGYGSRGEAQAAIKKAGGVSPGSVSKNTYCLVTDETTTSKAEKAAALGVPVVPPELFQQLLATGVIPQS